MNKEFKTNPSNFTNQISLVAIFIVIGIVFFVILKVFPGIILPFIIISTIMAFWGKDRTIITMYDDYLEAKETFAAKKKLIRYNNIEKLEERKRGKLLTIHLKNGTKKEHINLTIISETDRQEFIKSMNDKLLHATV